MSNTKMDNAAYESLWMKERMAFARQSPILHAWEVVGYLDKGQFSRVFKIRHKEKGTLAALKYIPNPTAAPCPTAPPVAPSEDEVEEYNPPKNTPKPVETPWMDPTVEEPNAPDSDDFI